MAQGVSSNILLNVTSGPLWNLNQYFLCVGSAMCILTSVWNGNTDMIGSAFFGSGTQLYGSCAFELRPQNHLNQFWHAQDDAINCIMNNEYSCSGNSGGMQYCYDSLTNSCSQDYSNFDAGSICQYGQTPSVEMCITDNTMWLNLQLFLYSSTRLILEGEFSETDCICITFTGSSGGCYDVVLKVFNDIKGVYNGFYDISDAYHNSDELCELEYSNSALYVSILPHKGACDSTLGFKLK